MNAQLQDAVLAIIAPAKAHQRTGSQDGEQSFSYLVSELRMRGWKNLGADFEDVLVANGFSIRRAQAGRSVHVYVGL